MKVLNKKTALALALCTTLSINLYANKAEKKEDVQILITNVDVWDGTSSKLKLKHDVLIVGNKISSVSQKIKKTDKMNVIDGKGFTVTPGLIDMHQHLNLNGGTIAGENWDAYVQGAHATRAAEYLLKSGFTTIRDIAGNTIGIKKAINTGKLPGPRVYSSGPAIGPTGGHSDWGGRLVEPGGSFYQKKVQNAHVVDGYDEVLKVARWNFRNGADFLKVMAGGGVASEFDPIDLQSPTPKEMEAAVTVANEYGGYVAIHAYTPQAYEKSIKAGVKSFEHGFLMDEKTVKMMKEADVWWSFQPFGAYTLLCGEYPDWYTQGMKDKAKMVCNGVIKTIKLMKKHKIKTFNGSDMFGWDNWHNAIINAATPATGLPDDLKYSSLETMKMSTSYAGEFLQKYSSPSRNPFKDAKLGVVEKGAWADVLIWKGNPIRDISLILEKENLKLIMKDGKIYKNLLVPPTHEEYRPQLKPSGYSFSM